MLNYVVYIFFITTLLSLWVTKSKHVWGSLLFITLVYGVLDDRLSLLGCIELLMCLASYYIATNTSCSNIFRVISAGIAIIMSLLLAMHILPGFNNLAVINQMRLSPNSQAYSMFLNLDKSMVGLFIIALSLPLISSMQQLKEVLITSLPIILFSIFVVIGVAYYIGYVELDVKWDNIFVLWAINNLLFVCVAEEALFRGFLQRYIAIYLHKYQYRQYISILIVAGLFGAAHFGGGLSYVALASIAGMFYGYVYYKTHSIEASIVCHFSVNACHFIFFSYPALA